MHALIHTPGGPRPGRREHPDAPYQRVVFWVLSGFAPTGLLGRWGTTGRLRTRRGQSYRWTACAAAPRRWRSGRIARPGATAGTAAGVAAGRSTRDGGA